MKIGIPDGIHEAVQAINLILKALPSIEEQGMITLPPKTKRSRRTIELDDNLVYYLKSLRGEQLVQRRALGLELGEEDYVCSYPDGKPILTRHSNSYL